MSRTSKFLQHWKVTAATIKAGVSLINAHAHAHGIPHGLSVAATLEEALDTAGPPGSPIRTAWLAYLSACDADYSRASAAYERGEAYATAAMKDDADV